MSTQLAAAEAATQTSPVPDTSTAPSTGAVPAPPPTGSAALVMARLTRLPVEPLEAAIRAAGGLGQAGVRAGDRNRQDPSSDAARADKRWTRAWHRARNQGWISLWAADELCVHILSLHPATVFGDIWWDTLTDIDAQQDLAEAAAAEAVADAPADAATPAVTARSA